MEQMNVNTDSSNGMALDGHSMAQMPALQRDIESSGEWNVLSSVLLLGAIHAQEGREFDIDAFAEGMKTYYAANKDDPKWGEMALAMLKDAKDPVEGPSDDGSGADDAAPSRADLDKLLAMLGIGGTSGDDDHDPSLDGDGTDPDLAGKLGMLGAMGDGGVASDDDAQDNFDPLGDSASAANDDDDDSAA